MSSRGCGYRYKTITTQTIYTNTVYILWMKLYIYKHPYFNMCLISSGHILVLSFSTITKHLFTSLFLHRQSQKTHHTLYLFLLFFHPPTPPSGFSYRLPRTPRLIGPYCISSSFFSFFIELRISPLSANCASIFLTA